MIIFDDISYNIKNIGKFSGRESVGKFWRYVGVVIGCYMMGSFALIIPLFVGAFERMEKFAAEHPDQTTVSSSPVSYQITVHGSHPELMPDIMPFFTINAAGCVLIVVALAAAVARRLHDSGHSGWFGALPLPFLAAGLVGFMKLWHSVSGMASQPDMRLFGALFANNVAYLGSLGFLIFLLTRPSDLIDNRFGAPLSE